MARSTHNLDGWNANGHRYPAVDEAVRKFEARLRGRFPEPTEAQASLLDYIVTLHSAILLTRHRLFARNTGAKRTGPLYVQLPVLVSTQLKCLRALGVVARDGDDSSEPEDPMQRIAEAAQRVIDERPKEASASASRA